MTVVKKSGWGTTRPGSAPVVWFAVIALLAIAPAQAQVTGVTATTSATQNLSCVADRGGQTYGCTAGEFVVGATVKQPAGGPVSCVAGTTITLSAIIDLSGTNADRYNGAAYFGQAVNAPGSFGGQCSVSRFPQSTSQTGTLGTFKGFSELDNPGSPATDTCGDYAAHGIEHWQIDNVAVLCASADTATTPTPLTVPYFLAYSQNKLTTGTCTNDSSTVLVPGSPSKCNSGNATVYTNANVPVTVLGWLNVTKQTLPVASAQSFTFSADNGGANLYNTSPTSFSLTNAGSQLVTMELGGAVNRTLVVTETSAVTGWDPTTTITCTAPGGGSAASYITIDNANRKITASLNSTNYGANCTVTNYQTLVRAAKALAPTADPGKFNLSAQTNVGTASAGDVGNGGVTAYAQWTSGAAVFSEQAGTATSLANYTTTVACVDDTAGGSLAPSSSSLSDNTTRSVTLTPPLHHQATCTFSNTRIGATLQLAKAWTNAHAGDIANIGATTGLTNNTSAFSATASAAGSSNTVTVYSGETAALPAESPMTGGGLLANYNTTLSCSGGALSGANGQSSNTLTITPSDGGKTIVCTYNNARKSAALQLRKVWTNANSGDGATIGATTGLSNNTTSFSATAPTSNNSGVAVTVYAGEVGTLPVESISPAASASNYNTTITCSGGTLSGSGDGQASGNAIAINPADAGATVLCTYNNSRKSATLRLAKAWGPNNSAGDTATVKIPSGFLNSASLTSGTSTAPTSTTGSSVTVYAGESGQMTESGTNIGNYAPTYACDNGVSVSSGGVVTIATADTGKAITCTATNTRKSATLTLTKTWSPNSIAGDTATVASSGFGNSASSGASVATNAGNTTTGTAITVYAGESGSISESFSSGSAANYTALLSCSGNANALSGGTLTISPSDVAITCTETNTRKSASLTLRKTWSANSIAGDTATVASTGFVNNASSGASVATSSGNTTTGAVVTVFAGESGTLGESFSVGSAINYTATLSCSGNANALSGNTLTIDASDAAIICTETNTRKNATLTLQKTWAANSIAGDQTTVSTTNFSNNASSGSSTAQAGGNTTTGTAATVYVGESGTIGEANFANIGNYAQAISCSGGGTLSGNTLSIAVADAGKSITCTEINTRKSATLRLAKAWGANSNPGDTATVAIPGGFINSASLTSGASTAPTNTTGSSVVVYAGESGQISESGANIGSYAPSYVCDNAVSVTAAGVVSIAAGDAGKTITCTVTNTRKTHTVTVQKSLSPGSDAGKFDLQINGATVASNVGNGGGGNTPGLGIGSSVSVAEVGNATNLANYTTTLSCAGATVTAGPNNQSGSFTLPDADITCTFVNTRKTHTVTVQKSLAPASDAGKFDLQINAANVATNIGDGGSGNTGGLAVGSQVSVAELGNATSLGNYATALNCSGATVSNGSNNQSGTFTLPDADVTCTFTNTRKPNLSASKSSNGPWTVGQSGATYTLTVQNSGGSPTIGTITVSDTLPAGITPQWSSPTTIGNWSCAYSGQNATCTSSAAVAVGASDAFTLPVNVTAGSVPSGTSASVTNHAAVGGGGDPYNGGNPPAPGNCSPSNDPHCASNSTTASTPASVTVAKTLDASTTTPIVGGQPIVYDLTAANSGGTAVSGYQFYEVVPKNTTFTSIQGDATTNCASGAAAGTLCTITFASVPSNGSTLRTITFTAVNPIPDGTTSVANEITDNSGSLPPGAGCSAGSGSAPGSCTTPPASCGASDPHCVQTSVAQADMSATGAATQTVTAGAPVSVATTCSNNGPDAATNATCTVTGVPAGYNPVTTCNPSPPVASLASSATIACSTTFTPTAPGIVTLTTTANSATPDSNASNDNATTIVNVVSSAAIATSKSLSTINGQAAAAGATVKAGDVLVYSITSSNGGDTAGATTLTEHVPNQTTYTGTDGGAWSCPLGSAAGVPCTATQNVSAHASASTTYTVTVNASASSGIVANTVASSADGACSNCGTSDPVVGADMGVAFKNLPRVMSPGQHLTGLTLTCTNSGPATATNATCTPSVATNDGITGGITNLVCAPTSGSTLAASASIVCSFDYTVPGTAGGSDDPTNAITFTGTTGAANDPNGANNSATANIAVIDALDDSLGTLSAAAGGTTTSVLANDTVGAAPVAIGAEGNAALIPGPAPTPAAGSITMNANGTISVAPGTSPGTYQFAYTLCANPPVAPAACDTATASVVVSASIAPQPDSGNATAGIASAPVTNVASNDTVNGAPATLGPSGNATVAQAGSWPPGIALNTTSGAVSVSASVPPGTYTLNYQLCDKSTPSPNCATTTVTITVAANIVPTPDAGNAVAGTASTPIANIAANDTVNGAPATLGPSGNATVATSGVWPSGITLDPNTGAVSTSASVLAGTYTLTYQLCDKLAPPDCKTTTITLSVTSALPASIVDPPFINKAVGVVDTQTLLWTIVVDNSRNSGTQSTEVRDPLPAGMSFVAGQIACQAYGASTLSRCQYDAANNRVLVDALLASDLGTIDPKTATNRVAIAFQAKYTAVPQPVTNVAQACWDPQNSANNIGACAQSASAAAQFAPAVAAPVNSRALLTLLGVLMLLIAAAHLPLRIARKR